MRRDSTDFSGRRRNYFLPQLCRQIQTRIVSLALRLSGDNHNNLTNALNKQAVRDHQLFINLFKQIREAAAELENIVRGLYKQITSVIRADEWASHWEQQIQQLLQAYYSNSIFKDQIIALFLEALASQNIPEDTIVSRGRADDQIINNYLREVKAIVSSSIEEINSNLPPETAELLKVSDELLSKVQAIFMQGRSELECALNACLQSKMEESRLQLSAIVHQTVSSLGEVKDQFMDIFSKVWAGEAADEEMNSLWLQLREEIQNTKHQFSLQTYSHIMSYYEKRCHQLRSWLLERATEYLISKFISSSPEMFICHCKTVSTLIDSKSFTFKLPLSSQLYLKQYQHKWRGKKKEEKDLMYDKHLLFIRYLSLERPEGIVRYHAEIEVPGGERSFKFVMDRGNANFINFEEGYKHFQKLTLNERVRYIVDIGEGLANLHQRGICHNDVTFRNTIRVNDRYKLIDFDVARVFIDVEERAKDCKIMRNPQERSILQLLIEIGKISERLFSKELKEDKIITKTNMVNPTTVVENINRLSEFHFLKNNNELIRMFSPDKAARNEAAELFRRDEKLGLLLDYERKTVGKRDANKLGLMLLKLMYLNKGKYYQPRIESAVIEFIKEIEFKGIDAVNYERYISVFKLSEEITDYLGIKILKLVAQLLNPDMNDRMPVSNFVLAFIQTLGIDKYPLSLRIPQVKIEAPSGLDVKERVNYHLRETDNSKRYHLIEKIVKIMMRTGLSIQNQNLEYQLLYRKIVENKKGSYEFKIKDFDKDKEIRLNRFYKIINSLLSVKLRNSKRGGIDGILGAAREFSCRIHQKQIEYSCTHASCPFKWLCAVCFSDYLQSNQHHYDQQGKQFHVLQHIHAKKLLPLVCCIETKRGEWFYCCSYCLTDFEERKQIKQMFRLTDGKPRLKDKICIEQICRQKPLFTSKDKHLHPLFDLNIPKIVKQTAESLITIDLEFNLTKIEAVKAQFHEVYAKMKSTINCLIEDRTKFGRLADVKVMLEVIMQLQSMHTTYTGGQFRKNQEYIPFLSQLFSHRLKVADMMNIAEYFIDKFEEKVEELSRELMNALKNHRQQRREWLITNKQLYVYYEDCNKIFKKEAISRKISMDSKPSEARSRSDIKQRSSIDRFQQEEPSEIESVMNEDTKEYCQNCIRVSQKKDIKTEVMAVTFSSHQVIFVCESCKGQYCQSQLLPIHTSKFEVEYDYDQELKQFRQRVNTVFNISFPAKLEEMIYFEMKEEQIQYIELVESLLLFEGNVDRISDFVKNYIGNAILNQRERDIANVYWILQQLVNCPEDYINIIEYACVRYLHKLKQLIDQINLKYQQFASIEQRDILNDASLMEQVTTYLTTKYDKLTNSGKSQQRYFSTISKRLGSKVNQLSIEQINTNKSNRNHVFDAARQRELLDIKWRREGYTNIQIYIFHNNRYLSDTFYLDKIADFNNLKQLCICEEPDEVSKVVLSSFCLQKIIKQCKSLNRIILKCLHGFDKDCFELMVAEQRRYQLDLFSYSAFQRQTVVKSQLFLTANPSEVQYAPFDLGPELLSIFVNEFIQMKSGEFRLDLTKPKFKETQQILKKMKPVVAHRFQILVSFIPFSEPQQQQIDMASIRKLFIDRNTNLTNKVNALMNENIKRIAPIFAIIPSKIMNIQHLILRGFTVNDEEGAYQLMYSPMMDFMDKCTLLTFLEIKRCFGLWINCIYRVAGQLQHLYIEDSYLSKRKDDLKNYSFILKSLVVKSSGYFQGTERSNFANSSDLTKLLPDWGLTQLHMLIINDCYTTTLSDIEWIYNNKQLTHLSLRRCMGINMNLAATVKAKLPQLKKADLAGSYPQEWKHKKQDEFRRYLIDREALMEVARIAELYNLVSLMNNNIITDQISLVGQRLRAFPDSKYKFLESIAIFSQQIEYLIIEESYYRSGTTNCPLNDFPFIHPLGKIKELTIVKCDICEINMGQINKYEFLRLLHLRYNSLSSFSNAQMGQLRDLDLMGNRISQLSLTKEGLPNLRKINIQKNALSQIPLCIFELPNLTIIVTDLSHVLPAQDPICSEKSVWMRYDSIHEWKQERKKVDQVGKKVDQVGKKVNQVGKKVDQVGKKVSLVVREADIEGLKDSSSKDGLKGVLRQLQYEVKCQVRPQLITGV